MGAKFVFKSVTTCLALCILLQKIGHVHYQLLQLVKMYFINRSNSHVGTYIATPFDIKLIDLSSVGGLKLRCLSNQGSHEKHLNIKRSLHS